MPNSRFAVTCRALIIDRGELLMVRHDPKANYLALPGGRLEASEHVATCLERELVEELGVHPVRGGLAFINDWVGPTTHRVEFFFLVKNGADYRHANPAAASHGFEISEIVWGNPTNPEFSLLPTFLRDKFPRLQELGDNYPTELIQSHTEK